MARYTSTLSNHQEGICPMYRPRQEREDQKRTSIINQKDTWFRSGGATSTSCVCFWKPTEENADHQQAPTLKLLKVMVSAPWLGLVKSKLFLNKSGKLVYPIKELGFV